VVVVISTHNAYTAKTLSVVTFYESRSQHMDVKRHASYSSKYYLMELNG